MVGIKILRNTCYNATEHVEPVLKDHRIGHKNVVFQDR